MNPATGRDGRPLVDTAMAAYAAGVKPSSFRAWAVRHAVKAAGSSPNPKGGQANALWDLADIATAMIAQHHARNPDPQPPLDQGQSRSA